MADLVSFVSSAAPTASAAAASKMTLSNNFDTFLTILTAQIQNQDPLEPMDSTQFTQQLVQFSGVEQQIRSNQQLETLISATRSSAGASLSGYLGRQAEIAGDSAQFSEDPINFLYALPENAQSASLSILDSSGRTVFTSEGATQAGRHVFTWDGQTASGGEARPGVYTLRVTAKSAAGDILTSEQSILAEITGVDLSQGEPALTTAFGIFAYSDIRRLTQS
jgi:flagellar basal-body rod modification protein FlgD